MERSRLGKPSLSQYKEARPVDPVFLAPSANGTPPESKHARAASLTSGCVPFLRLSGIQKNQLRVASACNTVFAQRNSFFALCAVE